MKNALEGAENSSRSLPAYSRSAWRRSANSPSPLPGPLNLRPDALFFAESEAVSRIAEGALPGDILAGIHKAMASKIMTLVTRVGLEEDCAVTGGGAKDLGLVKAIGAELGIDVLVADEPQITAALGAALLASERITR